MLTHTLLKGINSNQTDIQMDKRFQAEVEGTGWDDDANTKK